MTQTDAGRGAVDTSRPGWAFQLLFDPRFAAAPGPVFEWLRAGGVRRDVPPAEVSLPAVVVSRSADVEAVLRNPAVFSSRFGEGSVGLGNDRPLIPLQVDPPHHKKYRVLLDPFFAPRRMERHEKAVGELVNGLIDRFVDRRECDFVADFAVPLPCTVFLELLGLPLADLDFLLRVKEGIMRGDGEAGFEGQRAARISAGREFYEYFEDVLARCERGEADGLLRELLAAEVDGERLTREELIDICYLLVVAGLDTVTASLCCFWAHLAVDRADRRRVVEDPSVIPAAVEELMRRESPVSMVGRVASDHADVGGCPVHPGDMVVVLVGSANTDPAAIERAGLVDFDRPANRHYAFGGGIHRCLGSHLARLELRVAMREWHRRIPEYRIADGAELDWAPLVRSLRSLPLVLG